MDKMTINDLKNTKQTRKDRATQIPQQPLVKSGEPEGQAVPAALVIHVVLLH